MKILLDENIPVSLKNSFTGHFDVFTVAQMKWNGKKNGELLGLLVFNDFEALLTMDKNLQYQQSLSKFPVKLIVLNAPNNRLEILKPYVKKFCESFVDAVENQVTIIDI